MMTLIFAVEREWQALDGRKFGVGNISRADGVKTDHATHRKGVEVDIRQLRKDGERFPASYLSPDYDRDATRLLIALFGSNAPGRLTILFNDNEIVGVTPAAKHDNHFHVQF
jgi:penicillin-insensitive murein endopeptidase